MKLIRKMFIYDDPKPTPSCHASTIVRMNDDLLISAWFGGEREGANDVRIWTSFQKNGIWSEPIAIPSEKEIPHWNPVLMKVDDHTACLFYKVGYKIFEWQTWFTLTKDGGQTWSAPAELIPGDTSGGRGPVKNKGIFISDGTFLAPASSEQGAWLPFIDRYTKENGWEKAAIQVPSPEVGLIQPTLWEYPDGQIHALMRSNCGFVYRSDSADYGKTWSVAYQTELPNNNSGLDGVLTFDGTLVLVLNPVADNWGKRTPLSVFVSADQGVTFTKVLDLETEEGEFSYPAIIAHENRLYITYTWNRQKIAFCELEL